MSSTFDYSFDNSGRFGNDLSYLDQRSIQNMKQCNYITQNYFLPDLCTMSRPIDFATAQPGLMINSGSFGPSSCKIEDSSKLLIGTIQTHPPCKLDLFHRPFLTVPYLGRGMVNPVIESQILQGEPNINRKSATDPFAKTKNYYTSTPLQPYLKESFKLAGRQPNNLPLGGVSTRDQYRDTNTYN